MFWRHKGWKHQSIRILRRVSPAFSSIILYKPCALPQDLKSAILQRLGDSSGLAGVGGRSSIEKYHIVKEDMKTVRFLLAAAPLAVLSI